MDIKFNCIKCGEPKIADDFPLNRTNGREYRKKTCKTCDNRRRKLRKLKTYRERCEQDSTFKDRESKRASAAGKKKRKDPKLTARHIVQDSRKSDVKRGRDNNLDREWVDSQISNGCSYCGETELRMTLDRVDNSQGHTKDNVVPACIRCNYLRRDMPHVAWLLLLDGVKAARAAGAFGNWTGRTTKGG